jgi:two-component system C4-dicarboxylate transport sensor histidine kinase DctB
VVHELSNALNALALRVAVLQQKAGASLHAELEALRDQGRVAADWLRQLRHYRTQHRPTRSPVDLNRVVLRTVETVPASDRSVRTDLAPALPAVSATVTDLRLLTGLLLTSAVAVTPARGVIRVRTGQQGDRVLLHVEDQGPAAVPEQLPRLFEPFDGGRPGTNPLELAACEMMARRLEGTLRGENRDGGGMVFTLELRAVGV